MCKGMADRAAMNAWWMDRFIPDNRSGVREALEMLEINSTKMLLVRSYGLSLSNPSWICLEVLISPEMVSTFFTMISLSISGISCLVRGERRMA